MKNYINITAADLKQFSNIETNTSDKNNSFYQFMVKNVSGYFGNEKIPYPLYLAHKHINNNPKSSICTDMKNSGSYGGGEYKIIEMQYSMWINSKDGNFIKSMMLKNRGIENQDGSAAYTFSYDGNHSAIHLKVSRQSPVNNCRTLTLRYTFYVKNEVKPDMPKYSYDNEIMQALSNDWQSPIANFQITETSYIYDVVYNHDLSNINSVWGTVQQLNLSDIRITTPKPFLDNRIEILNYLNNNK